MPRAAAPFRVAILCEFGTVNGGERSLLAAISRLRDQMQPVFLAPNSGQLVQELSLLGCRQIPFDVREANGRRRDDDAVQRELAALVASLQPDLLHANSLTMGRLTGRIAGQLTIPCTAHLRDIISLTRTAVADLNGNARLFAVSSATRTFHTGQGIDPLRVLVLYNGVDADEFRPPRTEGERAYVRTSLGLQAEARVALTIGQLGLRKGLDVLAAAAPRIAAAHPQLHFVIVGERYSAKPESVAYEAAIVEALQAAGLSSRVHWLGYREDIAALLRGADLLIHPARQEPFGRVLLEAAASGLPIVATRVGGTAEMLTDGQSARLVPPHDPDELATSAIDLLTDTEGSQRLAAAARLRVQSQFSIAARADQLLQAWHAILRAA